MYGSMILKLIILFKMEHVELEIKNTFMSVNENIHISKVISVRKMIFYIFLFDFRYEV